MAKDKTVSPTKAPAITSLAELQKLCTQRKRVEFNIDGTDCALEVRRLTPAEEFKVAEVVESVIPPIIKGKTQEDDRLDLSNPAYLKQKMEAHTKARALALYLCVPAFSEAKPNLTNIDEITAYIQNQLNETVLDLLWKGVRESGVNLAELVNFT